MAISYSEAVGSLKEGGPTEDNFTDFLTMKVIGSKRVQTFGNAYGANANTLGFSHKKELVRNLGVRVDAVRLAELDAVTAILGCNKQEFVLELLVAGLEQAKAAIRTAGLRHLYDDALDRNMAAAGFTVEPSPNAGYWTLHHKGEPIVNRDAERHEKATAAMSEIIGENAAEPDA